MDDGPGELGCAHLLPIARVRGGQREDRLPDRHEHDMNPGRASMRSQHTPRSAWCRSSNSGNEDSYCVEVADFSNGIGIWDSKNPHGPVLLFDMSDWSGFVAAVRVGDLGSLFKPRGQRAWSRD
ncbi:DUF397 domain-containing protein [Streptomyces sp. NPDC055966]|uniref:DUF397 domain-containing protein n=1 Tax=Streptomyces sp. NPDC055966 TaxID=3345669 RepID=UPI0035DA3460